MKHLYFLLGLLFTLPALHVWGQGEKQLALASPDGRLQCAIRVGSQITYQVTYDGHEAIAPSTLSMTLSDGSVWGGAASRLTGTRKGSCNQMVASPFYRATSVSEQYESLTLNFRGGWSIELRAYNDGVAYRFATGRRKAFDVVAEEAAFHFPAEATATVPYVNPRSEDPFYSSFENTYVIKPIAQLDSERLMFLPLVINSGHGIKVLLSESDLESYPGMYLQQADGGLKGVFAPYPKRVEQGGHNMLQMVVKEREQYIARCDGQARTFPWRMAIVTNDDRTLAASHLSYLLASPSRITDTFWIKPGKTAWEWWNDWNLDGVSFETGINNATYKQYIDFAARCGVPYVLLDEGWAVNLKADLMQIVPEINLPELIAYAKAKGVGIVLWAGYWAFDRDMEQVCSHYAAMGVKGFKVDFMDRDDQPMTEFVHRAAAMCAKYHLILDLHGMYKPAGLNRTWPNVLNFEGVHGLENMKWSTLAQADQVTYDVTMPFIRQTAGPVDYTQGAMRNAVKANFYPCYTEPMSQGTRCRQLALYVLLESPFCMLADTPQQYDRNPGSRDFIASVPTVWDETRILQGRMGELLVVARRSGEHWYVGGATNWDARDIDLDLSFLTQGTDYHGTLYSDGPNAHRIGTDLKSATVKLNSNDKLRIHLAPGGGFALVLKK